ncbi:MAG: hypothetical protein F6K16_40245 [Symploca sp. SIO2B6]|nr:hypothetical protein [Symploca sp. SIO2B6]
MDSHLNEYSDEHLDKHSDHYLERRFKILESIVEDLHQASKLVNGVATRVHLLSEELDVSAFVRGVGHTLAHIFELDSQIYNIAPEFTPDFLRDSLEPINLNPALEHLSSSNLDIRKSTIKEFTSHMDDDETTKFLEECEVGSGIEFATQWWGQQQKPFVPIRRVYKQLRREQKYVRYHSAKKLEYVFDIHLWDEELDDVRLEDADRWFEDWLKHQA